jgi:hypothetical protein
MEYDYALVSQICGMKELPLCRVKEELRPLTHSRQ